MSEDKEGSLPSPSSGGVLVHEDGWSHLRRHTAARIALGRSGASLPTRETLAFGLAHAQARDAVHAPLDTQALSTALALETWESHVVTSQAPDRAAYLARPDWGRRLAAESLAGLRDSHARISAEAPDLVFVISDGLSAIAAQRHALPLLKAQKPLLGSLRVAIVIATQARVALADEIGEVLGARIAVSLIGERPGLSAPDSLGIYLTYAPRVGRSDAERNCISNVRPEGLSYAGAAAQLASLIRCALQQGLSGVPLRIESLPPSPSPGPSGHPLQQGARDKQG